MTYFKKRYILIDICQKGLYCDNESKSFQNGRSQAIRIPKEFRVDTDEVYIEKVGHTLVIVLKSKWDIMRDAVEDFDGFEFEIEQLPIQERDLF